MHNQIPQCVCDVSLHVSPEFSGRVLLHMEQGRLISDLRIHESYHLLNLEGFIELARRAGWRVEPIIEPNSGE
ncbi:MULTISPECIES: hypothetical protein [Serratia]|uniref:hypothetical protein n=1 Tax=Serratia TaxID=613 RepID=UPI001CBF58C9|nr:MULTISPECIES: hypothetical protein [Serratia]UAN57409.1 hypothetical protein KGP21_28115 [Serratia sp. JSRIV004]CAI0832219.1 Uncharacterised protein [Serratia fonticola]CAI0958268.1 Uncharacterised protein [Serratia fonticola]